MSTSSLRHTLRRRLAPLVLLLAFVLLGSRTCASEMTRVELRFELGAAAAQVETLRADVFPEGASMGVATFERHVRERPVHGPLGFEAALDPGSYRVRIEARTAAAARTLERAIVVGEQLGERTVITVDLGRDLLPAPGAD